MMIYYTICFHIYECLSFLLFPFFLEFPSPSFLNSVILFFLFSSAPLPHSTPLLFALSHSGLSSSAILWLNKCFNYFFQPKQSRVLSWHNVSHRAPLKVCRKKLNLPRCLHTPITPTNPATGQLLHSTATGWAAEEKRREEKMGGGGGGGEGGSWVTILFTELWVAHVAVS